MAKFLDWLQLVGLNLLVKKRNLCEYIRVIYRYYSNATFRAADLLLLSKYIFRSPFAVSKAFMEARGEEDVYVYGETPLTTLETIAKECKITSQDTVFELGSGRGRGCFWLNIILGCKVVGIEYIPEFVEKAHAVIEKYRLSNIEFRQQDFLKADFRGATVIYLYGTCLDPSSIQKLMGKLSKLPAGTKIISVSYALKEYAPMPSFETLKRFQADFTWGKGEVYLQVLKKIEYEK